MLLLCWFDHFLDSRAEICQIFRWFFGKSMTPKRHSEINWPLLITYKFRPSKSCPNTHFSTNYTAALQLRFQIMPNREKLDGLGFSYIPQTFLTSKIKIGRQALIFSWRNGKSNLRFNTISVHFCIMFLIKGKFRISPWCNAGQKFLTTNTKNPLYSSSS